MRTPGSPIDKERAMGKVKFAVIGLVLGLVLGVAGVLIIQNTDSSTGNSNVQPSVVFDRIVSKNELVSASQEYSITEKSTQDAATFFDLFDIPFTDTSFWYKYVGTIKVGVDLEKAEFSQDGSTITIALEQPYIISNTPNMDESGVLEQNNNLFASVPLEEVDEFQRKCIETSEENAVNGGLLNEAKTNAEDDIRDMFNAALGSAYSINFEWKTAQG